MVPIKTSELQGKNMKRNTTFMCVSGSLLPLPRQELASWQQKMEGNKEQKWVSVVSSFNICIIRR